MPSPLPAACRRVWHTGTGRCQASLTDTANPALSCVRFTPNGKYLLTGESLLLGGSREAVWGGWQGGQQARAGRQALGKRSVVVATAASVLTPYPLLACRAATLDSRLLLWDPHVRKVKKTYVGHLSQHSCCQAVFVTHSPDPRHKYVACGSEDHHVYVWDLQTRKVGVTHGPALVVPGWRGLTGLRTGWGMHDGGVMSWK